MFVNTSACVQFFFSQKIYFDEVIDPNKTNVL